MLAFASTQSPAHLLVAGGHDVARLNLKSLELDQHLSLQDVRVARCATLPDGRWLIAGAQDLEYGFLALYEPSSGRADWTHAELPAPVTSLAVAGEVCVVGDDQGSVSAFACTTGEPVWSAPLHSKLVTDLVALEEPLCASADWIGKIVLFDCRSGSEVANFQQHRDRVTSLAAALSSQPSRLLSTSRDATVRLWYPTQRRLVRFAQLPEPATALAKLSDREVVVATRDGQLHVVDMNAAKVQTKLPSQLDYVQALHPVGGQRVLASDGLRHLTVIDLGAERTAVPGE